MLWVYNMLLPAARLAVRAAAPLRPKLRAGLAGRAGVQERLAAIGRADAGRILWMHSTSVGEYEQARPIAALVRQRYPDTPILHTFFSPSGYEFAQRLDEAQYCEYLPEDTPAAVGRALDALRPRALVFLKFDLWPNLIAAAHRRGVPLLLFDATLHPGSWRSRWPARALYRDLYRRFDLLSAVSADDAARFRALVPEHPAIVIDGDTRYDQVVRRRRAARRTDLAAALVATPRPPTLVAGSTWGPDEAVLLPAWRQFVRQCGGAARLILVPHEPTPAHLERLENALRRAGLAARRYSEVVTAGLGADDPGLGVVVVDRVGILAELYAAGDLAYVGGAFTTGVHNLLEPAILGLPLLFGPRHHNAPEATLFLDAGAGTVVRSAADLGQALADWASDPERWRRTGGLARATVEANLGAAERCLGRLAPFLTQPSPARPVESSP